MADTPWLTVIGLGEDGPDGLCKASRDVLESAECIMGAARHLSLLPDVGTERIEWPVPYSDGVDLLMKRRGQPTVVLASGDPFWFGAGSVLAKRLDRSEWRAFSGQSVFSLAAARLGWPLEKTLCLGLHATPLTALRPHLATGRRIIATLRDGDAVAALGSYLTDAGFGDTPCTVLEALNGAREQTTEAVARDLGNGSFAHPVCIALDIKGDGAVMPLASGRADDWFDSDGQITKQPIRALTLSALAPRPFEHLWDIGGGSGSIGIEWLLTDPTLNATAIEPRADRAARIRDNADRLGVGRLTVVEGKAPDALQGLTPPDVVFVGGGLSQELITFLETLPKGTRIVANAVTLESEALLTQTHARLGGSLMRIEIANAVPIGPKRGWRASYPITQWSVQL